jgi:hypothetical protein
MHALPRARSKAVSLSSHATMVSSLLSSSLSREKRVIAAMPSLASDLKACLAPLLVMARDGDHDKRPWNDGHWLRLGLVIDQVGLQSMPVVA